MTKGDIAVSDGLGLFMKDLYPNYGGLETSNLATPDSNDQDALGEDREIQEKVSLTESSKKNILLAFGVLILLVVFFGVGKG